jgi:choline-sulfatase
MRRAYWDRYDHDDIDLPRIGPIPDDQLDPHSRRLRDVSAMDRTEVTEAHVRNARHAYYASIAYVDEWVGTVISTLEACGMAGDTVVIFTADHGDMLGERGLWYKMNFFEGACRIPLIVAGPGIAPATATENVSLLDVLPTLLEIAGVDRPDAADGTSLLPILGGDHEPDRTVYGEYLGEGAVAPILMIRRGSLKYIYCEADPPQLYDLAADPDELVNLCTLTEHTDTVAAFEAEVHKRWRPAEIRAAVVASQRARRTVDTALRKGRHVSWDHQPFEDSSNQYMRNHLDLNQVESSRRLPG